MRFIVVSALLATTLAAAGCRSDECHTLATYTFKCVRLNEPDVDAATQALLERCESEEADPELEHALACALDSETCVDFIACNDAGKDDGEREPLRGALAGGRWICDRHRDDRAAYPWLADLCARDDRARIAATVDAVRELAADGLITEAAERCENEAEALIVASGAFEAACAAVGTRRAGAGARHLRDLLEAGDFDAVVRECAADKATEGGISVEEANACRAASDQLFIALNERMDSVRTGELDESAADVCRKLETYAQSAPHDRLVESRGRCLMAVAEQAAARALAEVEANLEAEKLELPDACGAALGALRKVRGPWAVGKTGAVARACYVELGAEILAARLPSMGACDGEVAKVYRAVRALALRDPAIDELVAAAAEKCAE